MSQEKSDLKVIGAGFGRTGTLSFKLSLEALGYRTYHMKEAAERRHMWFWRKVAYGEKYHFSEIFQSEEVTFTACCDFPTCLYYKELMEEYPDAKVVLTHRDPEKWYKSAMETIFRTSLTSPNRLWGVTFLAWLGVFPLDPHVLHKLIDERVFGCDWSKEHMIQCYNDHIEEVKRLVPRDKLLIFEVSEGWEPLCKFLNKPIPANVSFPNVNDTKEFQRFIFAMNAAGFIAAGLLYGVLPTGLSYLSYLFFIK